MLSLTRRVGESIVIHGGTLGGDAVRLEVIRVRGDKVIMGFVARPEIVIDRLENLGRKGLKLNETSRANRTEST